MRPRFIALLEELAPITLQYADFLASSSSAYRNSSCQDPSVLHWKDVLLSQSLVLMNLRNEASLAAVPAIQQIALTHLAGFCQYAYQQHVSRQQQQHGESRRGARRRGGGKGGTLADTSTQGLSRGDSSKGGGASSQSGPGAEAGTAAAERSLSEDLASGFAELLLSPDHELAAVPGSKAAEW